MVIYSNQQKIIIDFYLKFMDINQSHNLFSLQFLSIDIGNKYSSMIGLSINYVWCAQNLPLYYTRVEATLHNWTLVELIFLDFSV